MPRHDFPHPLTTDVPANFCHPTRPGLTQPFHHDGNVYAGNGYIAIRCYQGLWLPNDFPSAAADTLARFQALPWEKFAGFTTALKSLHDLKPQLYRFREYPLWDTSNQKPAKAPIVLLAETWLIRLSHLQIISRLPRAELLGGIEGALAFRFAGGIGLIARDETIAGKPGSNPFDHERSFELLRPPRPHFDGVYLAPEKTAETPAEKAQSQRLMDHWHTSRAAGAWPPYDLAYDPPPPEPID